jgi:hypothetical protein
VSMDPWLVGEGRSSRTEIMCMCVPGLAGVRHAALQSEYCAVLYRLWGRGWQSRDRAGLGSMAQRDRGHAELCRPGGCVAWRRCKCLWIPGLKGSSQGDPADLRSGSLG